MLMRVYLLVGAGSLGVLRFRIFSGHLEQLSTKRCVTIRHRQNKGSPFAWEQED